MNHWVIDDGSSHIRAPGCGTDRSGPKNAVTLLRGPDFESGTSAIYVGANCEWSTMPKPRPRSLPGGILAVSRTFFGKAFSLPPSMSGMSSLGYVRRATAMGSLAWALVVASS
jgi:hypothetical protein